MATAFASHAIAAYLPAKYPTPKNDSEQVLINKALAGDQDAFAALYKTHLPHVRAAGWKMLRTDDLDDMCQDTFLLAFTRLSSFDGRSSFRTWITRIAMNQCLIQMRRWSQATNGDGNLVQLDAEDVAGDVLGQCLFACEDRALHAVPDRIDLARLMAELPPLQRAAVELRLAGELDRDSAKALSVSVPAVKSHMFRARQAMREIAQGRR